MTTESKISTKERCQKFERLVEVYQEKIGASELAITIHKVEDFNDEWAMEFHVGTVETQGNELAERISLSRSEFYKSLEQIFFVDLILCNTPESFSQFEKIKKDIKETIHKCFSKQLIKIKTINFPEFEVSRERQRRQVLLEQLQALIPLMQKLQREISQQEGEQVLSAPKQTLPVDQTFLAPPKASPSAMPSGVYMQLPIDPADGPKQ